MKNSILFLGITLVFSASVCSASNVFNHQNLQESVLSDFVLVSNEMSAVVKPTLLEHNEFFNPETVIRCDRSQSIAEIIVENDKVTEYTNIEELEFLDLRESMKKVIAQSDAIIENTVSDEVCPLNIERSIEDLIAELEMIIESKEANEVSPLDFKKINNTSIMGNTFNSKTFVGINKVL
jgi:hypothetical protein